MQDEFWLFAYGTLRQPEVQRELFGRLVESVPDVLPGFQLEWLPILDPHVVSLSGSEVHRVLRRGREQDRVAGAALRVTARDVASADAYEVSDYVRIEVVLESGRSAFVYVHREDAETR